MRTGSVLQSTSCRVSSDAKVMLAKCNVAQLNCDCPRRLKHQKHILPCTATRMKRVADVSALEEAREKVERYNVEFASIKGFL